MHNKFWIWVNAGVLIATIYGAAKAALQTGESITSFSMILFSVIPLLGIIGFFNELK
jgi:hypothetical protein